MSDQHSRGRTKDWREDIFSVIYEKNIVEHLVEEIKDEVW